MVTENRTITLNGHRLPLKHFSEPAFKKLFPDTDFFSDIGAFLAQWANPSEYLELKTSGSTGIPKTITAPKKLLEFSAVQTCTFFGLNASHTALLCLPVTYIAGKMMLIRAIVSGMNVICIPPQGHIAEQINQTIHFAAMVPVQVQKAVSHPNFAFIKNLIIGGGRVPEPLIEMLKNTLVHGFETFGMTETFSHIALKQLTPVTHNRFTVFNGVQITVNSANQLIISCDGLHIKNLLTNDIVELHSPTQFRWIGRTDFVINAGGIKISPEQIEQQLTPHIPHPFYITGQPDALLGEIPVLLIEANPFNTTELVNFMRSVLPAYHIPKQIYFLPLFTRTQSGKIIRTKMK